MHSLETRANWEGVRNVRKKVSAKREDRSKRRDLGAIPKHALIARSIEVRVCPVLYTTSSNGSGKPRDVWRRQERLHANIGVSPVQRRPLLSVFLVRDCLGTWRRYWKLDRALVKSFELRGLFVCWVVFLGCYRRKRFDQFWRDRLESVSTEVGQMILRGWI